MDIVTVLIDFLLFIFPAYCANAIPVLAGGGAKMDFGKNFLDGKRIFGDHKTFRGFFFGWLIGALVGLAEVWIFGNQFLFSTLSPSTAYLFCILIPLGALVGDLAGAFAKRRLGIAPGGLLPVVDQIDFVVGALLFAIPLAMIGWEVAVTVLIITPPIHLLTNFLAYKLKLKKNPW